MNLTHGDLTVSADGRSLVHADGTPFLFLADTAWQLFHKLTREQVEWYLEDRRAKGFTVILASVMPDYHPLDAPNQYGRTPLIDADPTQPDVGTGTYDFWEHVDWVIGRAAEKGLYIGLLPTWGDKVVKLVGLGPEILDPGNAATYGRWIAQRYKDADNITWVLGGDRSAVGHEDLWNAMAAAIMAVDSRHLMTYHPWTYRRFLYYPVWGGGTSATWFHEADWLDFNMFQSGHWGYNRANYSVVSSLYDLTPTKPCIDGEPNYEGHAHQGCPTAWPGGPHSLVPVDPGAPGEAGLLVLRHRELPDRVMAVHVAESPCEQRPVGGLAHIRVPEPFAILAAHDVLSREIADQMARASGFRNTLVHEYIAVRDDLVVANLSRTGDVRRFVAEIADWLAIPR